MTRGQVVCQRIGLESNCDAPNMRTMMVIVAVIVCRCRPACGDVDDWGLQSIFINLLGGCKVVSTEMETQAQQTPPTQSQQPLPGVGRLSLLGVNIAPRRAVGPDGAARGG